MAIKTLPAPQNLIIASFCFLAASAIAVSPLGLLFRSLAILLMMYIAFIVNGMPFAYLIAVVSPALGLFRGDEAWLIMLPIILVSFLLAALGLEYAWRYPAIAVSPLLCILPQIIADQLSKQDLFSIALPWGTASTWIALHALIALAGVLCAVYFDRQRQKH